MLNYYQVLECENFTEPENVKKAYRNKCREYHPDRLSTLGGKLRDLAESEMMIINKAYDILSDPGRKSKFDEWLKKATLGNVLAPCRRCGVHYASADPDNPGDVCPICIQHSERNREIAAEAAPGTIRPQDIIRNCFIVIHHFVASSTLLKFNPSVYLMVSGEAILATGAPGALVVTITNKYTFERIHPDMSMIKHKWNSKLEMGTISFNKSHPVDAADTLWNFFTTLFGKPRIEYCRIEIDNEEFRPYEHVLNQSVMVLSAEVSPWNASKLLTRHRRNIITASMDPEAINPDPFLTVLAGAAAPDSSTDKSNIHEQHDLLQSSLLATKEQLVSQKQALDNWKEQVEELIGQISLLKKENAELRGQISESDNLRLQAAHLETENAALKNQVRGSLILKEQLNRLDFINTSLEDKFISEQKYIDRITDLENELSASRRDNSIAESILASSARMSTAVERFDDLNAVAAEIILKLASVESFASERARDLVQQLGALADKFKAASESAGAETDVKEPAKAKAADKKPATKTPAKNAKKSRKK